MKSLGKKQQYMQRLEKYLEENLDDLWDNHKKTKLINNGSNKPYRGSILYKKSSLRNNKGPALKYFSS